MEDMMKALLDVVRAQHTATEGSEERPFDINDIIDMALNITGRPEEPEEQQELSDTIQKLAESLAPDIFPPKTFEEMDDSEQAACSEYDRGTVKKWWQKKRDSSPTVTTGNDSTAE